mmetsp:Transcript_19642/g.61715  ORF Transcript_19642/g.61715 Transcript_19642/m.61715 type:complete len:302 (-) Transcript_19642:497-1402(-)
MLPAGCDGHDGLGSDIRSAIIEALDKVLQERGRLLAHVAKPSQCGTPHCGVYVLDQVGHLARCSGARLVRGLGDVPNRRARGSDNKGVRVLEEIDELVLKSGTGFAHLSECRDTGDLHLKVGGTKLLGERGCGLRCLLAHCAQGSRGCAGGLAERRGHLPPHTGNGHHVGGGVLLGVRKEPLQGVDLGVRDLAHGTEGGRSSDAHSHLAAAQVPAQIPDVRRGLVTKACEQLHGIDADKHIRVSQQLAGRGLVRLCTVLGHRAKGCRPDARLAALQHASKSVDLGIHGSETNAGTNDNLDV